MDEHGVAVIPSAVSGYVATTGQGGRRYRRYGKRMFDILAVALALPFLVPLMLLIGMAVMMDGRSPVYVQKRIGMNGRRFRLFKFRSMRPDADRVLAAYLDQNPAAAAEWQANQKLRRDPRITAVGRIIRKSSLDELPQLLNVLIGDMSLVGPRPMMPCQRDAYPGHEYELMRPGLTGLWQVSERNGTTFAARAKYDREYYQAQSFRLDMLTLWRTIGVVLRCTGC